MAGAAQSQEIYNYEAPWPIYAMNWSQKKSKPFRLAIGSYIDEYSNTVRIIDMDGTDEFKCTGEFTSIYPATKIMFIPDPSDNYPDLLATTGDYLRVWKIPDDKGDPSLECVLSLTKPGKDYISPVTSFDWNEHEPTMIGTSCIDTTCSIWDLTTGSVKAKTAVVKTSGEIRTQLIAHDQPVYDMAFQPFSNYAFASVGADGSVRMFDIRDLKNSNILWDEPTPTPLLRLNWNKIDNNEMGLIKMDSNDVVIVDIRKSSKPVEILKGHDACVNGMSWSPVSQYHLCTAADDKKALIWDKQFEKHTGAAEPILSYEAKGPINQIHWSSFQNEWIAITYDNTLEILRI